MEAATTAFPRPDTLSALLALDASRRVVGVTDGLVPLEALAAQSWDFSAPTLVGDGGSSYKERSLCPDSASFAREFYAAYPALEGVPLDGLLVAGGAVGQFLMRRGSKARLWHAADVDVFLYGHESSAASQARLRAFIADLEAGAHLQGRESVRARFEKAARAPPVEPARSHDAKRPSWQQGAGPISRWLLELLPSLVFTERSAGEGVYAPARPEAVTEVAWDTALSSAPDLAYSLPEVGVVRTAGSVTITCAGLRLQVVLRHYAAASEILHGFDLGPAAAGFDGRQVWLTELGRFSYETRCLVVDTGRRSLTYEARLMKYGARGFDMVFPGLRVEALSRRNLKYGYSEVADLPGFPFAYSAVAGNRITFAAFPVSHGPASDYGPEDGADDENSFALAFMNLYRLVNGRTDFIYAASGPGFAAAVAVLDKPPHLTLEMIQRLYDNFRKTCWDGARLNVRTFERYVPVMSLKDLTAAVYADGRPMAETLDAAFAAQRAEATRLWKLRIQAADHSVLPWVTENPGGQQGPLTGSVHPLAADPAAWYGEYYAL